MNETLKGKQGCCIDLVFTDVTDCFNSLWTEKTVLDLHENGIETNLLNLIYELSKSANISIKTPVGITEKKSIEDIIKQGETLSSISCTSTMDRISKESKKETFKYRKSVQIPKMGYIDDLLDVNKCGNPIKEQHDFTTNELNKRKLQTNFDKSGRMHIRNKKDSCPDGKCKELKVDKWKVHKRGEGENACIEDKYEGKVPIKTVKNYLYLGNIIEFDGSNNLTIKERVAKGQGASKEILHILEEVYFGEKFIDAFKLLRNSKLISILSYNIEVIHGLTKRDIQCLDKIDVVLARKVLKLSSRSTRCLILLELQLIPIEFIIESKRINYLRTVLTSSDSSLVKVVLKNSGKIQFKVILQLL